MNSEVELRRFASYNPQTSSWDHTSGSNPSYQSYNHQNKPNDVVDPTSNDRMYDVVPGEKPPRLPDARQTTPNTLYASRGETLSHPTATLEMQPYSTDNAAEVDVDYVSSKCLRVLCLSILVVVSLFLAIVAVVLVMLLWFGVYTPDYTCPTISSPTTQPQTGSTQPSESPSESPITCTCPAPNLSSIIIRIEEETENLTNLIKLLDSDIDAFVSQSNTTDNSLRLQANSISTFITNVNDTCYETLVNVTSQNASIAGLNFNAELHNVAVFNSCIYEYVDNCSMPQHVFNCTTEFHNVIVDGYYNLDLACHVSNTGVNQAVLYGPLSNLRFTPQNGQTISDTDPANVVFSKSQMRSYSRGVVMANLEYGLLSKKTNQAIPLKHIGVKGHLTGYTVGLEARLSYHNDSNDPVEVLFRFPLEETMAVVGLEAVIGGITIRGEIQEKEKARVIYDDAIASGLTAAIGEEKTGDIFSLALGNLPPKGDATISLKLVNELPIESEPEAVRFTLPTVLKLRYTPAGSVDPLAPVKYEGGSQVSHGNATVSDFILEVDGVNSISNITSPTHDIVVIDKTDLKEVSLKSTSSLDKDFILFITYKEPHQPRSVVEGGQTGGNDFMSSPVVMLDFFPDFASIPASCEFVFLIDRSGSMAGTPIKQAKETLILFLKSIPPGCYFNIIGFGSDFRHLFPQSVPYNQSNLDKALKHAETLSADLGGTELLPPLRYVFNQEMVLGLPRQVFVLTDGSVSNTKACISIAKENAHVARVFTFGIGSGVSTELVGGLARAGNGSAEFIQAGERMQPKVISSLKKALQPSVTNVQLQFTVPTGIEVLQAPAKIPAVFKGERLIMYCVLKGGGIAQGQCTATLTGQVLGKVIEHKLNFEIGSAPSLSSLVHQLAAKCLIKDWQSGNGPAMNWSEPEKKASIVKLSLESNVLSSYTAYVVVNEDQKEPIEGALKIWDVTAAKERLRRYSDSSGSNSSLNSFESFEYDEKYSEDDDNMAAAVQCEKNFENQLLGFNQECKEEDEESGPSIVHRKVFGSNKLPSKKKKTQPSIDTSIFDRLSQLVRLQTAEGYWKLNDSLATLLEQTLSHLQSVCPSGQNFEVWATILSLCCLETKFLAQKDEWELVAAKAEQWLLTVVGLEALSSLKQAATKCLN